MRNSSKTALLIIAILAEATVATAQSGGSSSDSKEERLICRRTPETGSLVKGRRQCFTKAQWDQIAQSQQEGARKTIDGLMTRPAGE